MFIQLSVRELKSIQYYRGREVLKKANDSFGEIEGFWNQPKLIYRLVLFIKLSRQI